MITQQQIDQYHRDGFIVVEDVLPSTTVEALQTEVDRFVQESASVTDHTVLYDLEDGHTTDSPRVRRLKNPDKHSELFWVTGRVASGLGVLSPHERRPCRRRFHD